MPYVTELVVGICVVRSQSDSCLQVKQMSGQRDSCPGMRAVDGLQQVCCVRVCCMSAWMHWTVEGCSCQISCVVMSSE